MSVNTSGCTVYAHASLSLNDIVDIIQRSKDLISKFNFLSPADVADTELLLAWLGRRGTVVRTRGRDASKIYAWAHSPMVCECGCKINRGLIHKHRKTKKHARFMFEKATPSIAHDDDACMMYDDDDDLFIMMVYDDDYVCMLALNPS